MFTVLGLIFVFYLAFILFKYGVRFMILQDMPMEFCLYWYSIDDEKLVGEEKLEATKNQIRDWFYMQDYSEMIGASFSLTASQRQKLQPLTKHEIDLNKYDYFIEAQGKI